jgi:hypothetical protein
MDFLERVLDRVADFLEIDLAYDVKSVFSHALIAY